MNDKVAIIGAGQLATILAHRIPGSVRKVIISRRKGEAVQLADEVGAIASDQPSAVRGCRAVLLAVPGSAVGQVVTDVEPHLQSETLLVNMATDLVTSEIPAVDGARIAAAKVIGHVREMAMGVPGIVLIDRVEPADVAFLEGLLSGLGPVVQGDEQQVMLAQRVIVETMVRAEAELRQRLTEVGLAAELLPIAISSAAPGVLRAVSKGEIAPFAQEEIGKMGAGETTGS